MVHRPNTASLSPRETSATPSSPLLLRTVWKPSCRVRPPPPPSTNFPSPYILTCLVVDPVQVPAPLEATPEPWLLAPATKLAPNEDYEDHTSMRLDKSEEGDHDIVVDSPKPQQAQVAQNPPQQPDQETSQQPSSQHDAPEDNALGLEDVSRLIESLSLTPSQPPPPAVIPVAMDDDDSDDDNNLFTAVKKATKSRREAEGGMDSALSGHSALLEPPPEPAKEQVFEPTRKASVKRSHRNMGSGIDKHILRANRIQQRKDSKDKHILKRIKNKPKQANTLHKWIPFLCNLGSTSGARGTDRYQKCYHWSATSVWTITVKIVDLSDTILSLFPGEFKFYVLKDVDLGCLLDSSSEDGSDQE